MSRHEQPSIRSQQRADLRKLQAAIQSVDWNIPCSNDNRWISDDPGDQVQAAARCTGCPVFATCHEYITRWPKESGTYAGTTEAQRQSKGWNRE